MFISIGGLRNKLRNKNNENMMQNLNMQSAVVCAHKYFQDNPAPNIPDFYKAMDGQWDSFLPHIPHGLLSAVTISKEHILVSLRTLFGDILTPEMQKAIIYEAKFDQLETKLKCDFPLLYNAYLDLTGPQQAPARFHILNENNLQIVLTAINCSLNEIVQAYSFGKWFLNILGNHNEFSANMDWKSLVSVFASEKLFVAPVGMEPDSHLSLMCLCGLLSNKESPIYIPRGQYFNWSTVPCFTSVSPDGNMQNKAEALIKAVDLLATRLNMSHLYLAQNFDYILQHMQWLIKCTDSDRSTPFQLAAAHYQMVVKTDFDEREEVEATDQLEQRLAKCAQLKAELLLKIGDLNSRHKERFQCISCEIGFDYYHPKGNIPPYESQVPSDKMDTALICQACTSLLCCVCKEKICTLAEEQEKMICTVCQQLPCIHCGNILPDKEALMRGTCETCYINLYCKRCKQLIPAGTITLKQHLCSTCCSCKKCEKHVDHALEQIMEICTECAVKEVMDN